MTVLIPHRDGETVPEVKPLVETETGAVLKIGDTIIALPKTGPRGRVCLGDIDTEAALICRADGKTFVAEGVK